MKHTKKITIILILAFLLAQFIGLGVIYKYIDQNKSREEGKTVFKDLPIGERPVLKEQTSFLPIMLMIIFGTVLLLILIRFRMNFLWRAWFFLAILFSLIIVLGIFLPLLVSVLISTILTFWKVFKPNFWIHNLTELFIYGGLAAILVPIFNLFSISILLVLIALYDAYAVWKSKHMIQLAKSQADAKVFAGLLIPYLPKKKEGDSELITKKMKKVSAKISSSKVSSKGRMAILGGGDLGFPLVFAGVVMKDLGIWQGLLIPLFSVCGLMYLLYFGKEKKFYPAMPFIGAGCFLGLLVVWLIGMI